MTIFSDLLDGYRRFRSDQWQTQRQRWDELKEGQSPKVMIIACSDSRVDPTQIFDTDPGETFCLTMPGPRSRTITAISTAKRHNWRWSMKASGRA